MKNKFIDIFKKIVLKLRIINIMSLPLYIFRIFPIDNKKIICTSFNGKGYGDNPKYIIDNLINNNIKNLKIIWCLDKKNTLNEDVIGIKTVRIYSLKWFYEMATSKVWINNTRYDLFMKKRKDQIYIQTWHGGLALKKIEYDAEDKLSNYYKEVIKNDNKMIDIMLSNSDFCDTMYRRGFKYKGKIITYGSPRNDVLLKDKTGYIKKIKKELKLTDNKILLYAPTFRKSYDSNPYDINLDLLKKTLEEKTNEKWTILVKLHPLLANNSEKYINSKDCTDASKYPDMQELICACDLLITDYSSTMFESMIANKPVIIYANDIDNYADERGFYFKFNELPFPLTRNNKELINYIENNNIKDIPNNYIEFNKKIGLKETGQASKKVVEEIMKVVESK